MRQKNETATSFNKLKDLTLAIQAQKRSAQTSENANISEIASQSAPKPKAKERAKKGALKPTKKAFSERQKTTIRDNSQASIKKSLETQQSDKQGGRFDKQGDNANAFKGDEKNTRGQQC
ncbi:hypothetical protein MPG82_06110 [Helicobacter pylori]|uniref:hypothetical protein n=1 Tax=Helicobacter pylori TaxID=210 RepID=UPI001FD03653|nr:hypothetical protein [Helicobacter pylori]UOR71815.1 hypothetical protein MPG82_06110 [Helicobacter pylori]